MESHDTLLESLNAVRAVWNIPVAKYVRDLVEGTVDAISLTKDDPYLYFFARHFEESLSITIKEDSDAFTPLVRVLRNRVSGCLELRFKGCQIS